MKKLIMEYADYLEHKSADSGRCPACGEHLDSGRCKCTEEEQEAGPQGCTCPIGQDNCTC